MVPAIPCPPIFGDGAHRLNRRGQLKSDIPTADNGIDIGSGSEGIDLAPVTRGVTKGDKIIAVHIGHRSNGGEIDVTPNPL